MCVPTVLSTRLLSEDHVLKLSILNLAAVREQFHITVYTKCQAH